MMKVRCSVCKVSQELFSLSAILVNEKEDEIRLFIDLFLNPCIV